MNKFIAERQLLYSLKGNSLREKLFVRISAPYPVEKDKVGFKFDADTSACKIKFDGLPQGITEEVFGMDSIQALELASNIDPYLKGLGKDYDFYWASGEPYFDE